MMKQTNILAYTGLVLVMMFASACSSASEVEPAPAVALQTEYGQESLEKAVSGEAPAVEMSMEDLDELQASGDISTEEIDGLLLMREEEKLAHDVYSALYEEWGQNVFNNIASSEAAHMEAVAGLLERFGIDDPVGDNGQGEFESEELQALYDDLLEMGTVSLEDALRVGAAVEEIDIVDLQDLMALSTDPEILQVYGNLLAGSENHLRAFVRTLERQTGSSYQPEYMESDAFDLVMEAESAGRSVSGGRGGGSGRGAGGRNSQG